jgi:hypothetical protein
MCANRTYRVGHGLAIRFLSNREMSFMRHRRTSHLALIAAVTFSLSACTFTTAAGSPKAGEPPRATREAATAPTAAV